MDALVHPLRRDLADRSGWRGARRRTSPGSTITPAPGGGTRRPSPSAVAGATEDGRAAGRLPPGRHLGGRGLPRRWRGRWPSGAPATEATLEVAVPGARAWSPEDPHLYDCVVLASGRRRAPHRRTTARSRRRRAGRGGGRGGHVLRAADGGARGGGAASPTSTSCSTGPRSTCAGPSTRPSTPRACTPTPPTPPSAPTSQAAKALGLNLLRCHIKVNDPRYYYWCDRLGVLMHVRPALAPASTPPRARANWEHTFRDGPRPRLLPPLHLRLDPVQRDLGPRGAPDARRAGAGSRRCSTWPRRSTRTRLVEDNSAYLYDHVVTDINTWHFYIGDYDRARRHVQRVVAQSYEGSPLSTTSAASTPTSPGPRPTARGRSPC